MKSTTKILLYSFCFLAVLSCRKEQTFTVKIFNPVTGVGYEGYGIQIVEGTSTVPCLGCPSESNVMFFGTTNADGEVLVTERFHKDYSYSVHVSNSNNVDFCYNNAYHEGYNTGGMKINLRMSKIEGSTAYLELVPCAYLKFYIKNENCQGAADNIKIVYQGAEPIDDEDFRVGDTIVNLDGCVDILGDVWFPYVMGTRYYQYIITQGSNQTIINDTVHLNENEYVQHDIIY